MQVTKLVIMAHLKLGEKNPSRIGSVQCLNIVIITFPPLCLVMISQLALV